MFPAQQTVRAHPPIDASRHSRPSPIHRPQPHGAVAQAHPHNALPDDPHIRDASIDVISRQQRRGALDASAPLTQACHPLSRNGQAQRLTPEADQRARLLSGFFCCRRACGVRCGCLDRRLGVSSRALRVLHWIEMTFLGFWFVCLAPRRVQKGGRMEVKVLHQPLVSLIPPAPLPPFSPTPPPLSQWPTQETSSAATRFVLLHPSIRLSTDAPYRRTSRTRTRPTSPRSTRAPCSATWTPPARRRPTRTRARTRATLLAATRLR